MICDLDACAKVPIHPLDDVVGYHERSRDRTTLRNLDPDACPNARRNRDNIGDAVAGDLRLCGGQYRDGSESRTVKVDTAHSEVDRGKDANRTGPSSDGRHVVTDGFAEELHIVEKPYEPRACYRGPEVERFGSVRGIGGFQQDCSPAVNRVLDVEYIGGEHARRIDNGIGRRTRDRNETPYGNAQRHSRSHNPPFKLMHESTKCQGSENRPG